MAPLKVGGFAAARLSDPAIAPWMRMQTESKASSRFVVPQNPHDKIFVIDEPLMMRLKQCAVESAD
jgi:hypothetical protein